MARDDRDQIFFTKILQEPNAARRHLLANTLPRNRSFPPPKVATVASARLIFAPQEETGKTSRMFPSRISETLYAHQAVRDRNPAPAQSISFSHRETIPTRTREAPIARMGLKPPRLRSQRARGSPLRVRADDLCNVVNRDVNCTRPAARIPEEEPRYRDQNRTCTVAHAL